MRLVFWFKISGVNNTGNLANKIFSDEQKRNIDSANSMGMEEETGSICANKWADFIVLGRSLHELVPEEIGAIDVQQTFWKGNQVWG